MRSTRTPKMLLAGLVVLAACGGGDDDTSGGRDGGFADAAAPDAAGPDAADLPDGPPVRQACTSNFGSALTAVHGRLDGILVSIVPPMNAQPCNADGDHVHLQVQANGGIYDVAINVSDVELVDYRTLDAPLEGPAWSEGWHVGIDGGLDYVGLGVHAGDFTPTSEPELVSAIDTELAQANHVSIFMTAYGPDGGHNIHRRSGLLDGAVVVRPLSAHPRYLLFHFANQTF